MEPTLTHDAHVILIFLLYTSGFSLAGALVALLYELWSDYRRNLAARRRMSEVHHDDR